MAILAVVAMAGMVWLSLRTTDPPALEPAPAEQRVQLQTLPPAMFTGKTRDAYQAAKDVPQVLEQIPCYCGCMQNNGHQHNLHCFMDGHGAT